MYRNPIRLCGPTAPQEWLSPQWSSNNIRLLLDTGTKPDQAKLVMEYRLFTGERPHGIFGFHRGELSLMKMPLE